MSVDLGRAATALERFSRSTAYFEANRERLVSDHPGEWVAIIDGQPFCFGAAPEEIVDRLGEHPDILGVAFIEHLSNDPDVFILPS